MKFALINQYAELDVDTRWRIFASLLNLKRVMVDVFVRSVEGFLMAESWTSNQAQVRVDEHFTTPRQVQSRGRRDIFYKSSTWSRRKPSLNLFRSLCQNLVSILVLILFRRSMLIFNRNFFLSDICLIDFIFPAKKLRKIRGA